MMKNLGSMMKQAQEMQTKMQEMQARLEESEMIGSSGAGMVSATMSGKGELRRLTPCMRCSAHRGSHWMPPRAHLWSPASGPTSVACVCIPTRRRLDRLEQ